MEYLCNQIAKYLGLWVPDHFFIRFQNSLETFVCRNFMQEHPDSNLVHIYRYLDKPTDCTCEGLLEVIQRQVGRFEDIHRFVTLTLFDALIGNHDRHGRNIGLIQSANKSVLAPFYDNPSYIALEDPLLLGAFHEPRGAIATKETMEPTMKDYVKEWIRLGLRDSIVQFKNHIDIGNIQSLIFQSYVSQKRQQALLKLIQRRYQELCNEIQ